MKHIRYCTILPQLGLLVAVTLDASTGEGLCFGPPTADGAWGLKFANGDLAYYKNPLMSDLNAQYGDLPSRIAREFIPHRLRTIINP